MGKFPEVGTRKLSKCPGVGTKKEGKCPAPGIVAFQHFCGFFLNLKIHKFKNLLNLNFNKMMMMMMMYPGFQRIFFSDRYFAAKPR